MFAILGVELAWNFGIRIFYYTRLHTALRPRFKIVRYVGEVIFGQIPHLDQFFVYGEDMDPLYYKKSRFPYRTLRRDEKAIMKPVIQRYMISIVRAAVVCGIIGAKYNFRIFPYRAAMITNMLELFVYFFFSILWCCYFASYDSEVSAMRTSVHNDADNISIDSGDIEAACRLAECFTKCTFLVCRDICCADGNSGGDGINGGDCDCGDCNCDCGDCNCGDCDCDCGDCDCGD